MKLKVYKSLWGMEGACEEQLASASEAGYDGVEAPLPSKEEEKRFRDALERHGLSYNALIYTHGYHEVSFAEQIARATALGPELVVAHSAKDSMNEDEQDRFFERALQVEQERGIAVGHETHRGRAMFTPWATARLLTKYPELRLTADFSHWVNVCESHLEDHGEAIELAIQRTIHIHGRIGFPEGPQVPHPASPFFKTELELFLGWWFRIFTDQLQSGEEETTFTAEFGPPGYMPVDPFTNKPVADLWEVNEWMTDMVKKRFQEKFS